jgi:hypothetical protein
MSDTRTAIDVQLFTRDLTGFRKCDTASAISSTSEIRPIGEVD